MLFGNVQRNPVSRFVAEIPMSLFLAKSSRRGTAANYTPTLTEGSRYSESQTAPQWDDLARATLQKKSLAPAGSNNRPFRLGDKVKHAQFGSGTVVNYEGDSLITVAFPSPVGIKKLDLGFAKLEKA
jgi:DNA helicase-2/ATP-dependent DNA helicase PcrA